jgi:hypothetical protein
LADAAVCVSWEYRRALGANDTDADSVILLEFEGVDRDASPDDAGIEHRERSLGLERACGVVVADGWALHRPAPVERHLLLRSEPVDSVSTTLSSNWNRDRLRRARATYAEAPGLLVRMTASRG